MKRLQDPLSWRELKLAWEEEVRKKARIGISSIASTPCDRASKAIGGSESRVEIGHAHFSAMVFRFPHHSNRAKGMPSGKNEPAKAAAIELGRYGRPLRRQRH